MLRCRRIGASGLAIENGRTISERPDTRPVRHLQKAIRHNAATIQPAGELSDKSIRRRSRCPDYGLSFNTRAIAQTNLVLAYLNHLRIEPNLDPALCQFFCAYSPNFGPNSGRITFPGCTKTTRMES